MRRTLPTSCRNLARLKPSTRPTSPAFSRSSLRPKPSTWQTSPTSSRSLVRPKPSTWRMSPNSERSLRRRMRSTWPKISSFTKELQAAEASLTKAFGVVEADKGKACQVGQLTEQLQVVEAKVGQLQEQLVAAQRAEEVRAIVILIKHPHISNPSTWTRPSFLLC